MKYDPPRMSPIDTTEKSVHSGSPHEDGGDDREVKLKQGNEMNLIDVYNLLTTGEVTEEQAATALGLTVRDLRFRMSRWGHRLPLLLATLDKIRADTISREEAAKAVGVSDRQINKLQDTWRIVRPLKPYLVKRAATQIKWEIRKKYAIDYIAGGIEIAESADSAGVSVRQMRRWVSDILMKHREMPFKDLSLLSANRRKRLADEIETAENLELAKQNVLKSIADGKMSVHEEALKRLLSKRTMKERGSPRV